MKRFLVLFLVIGCFCTFEIAFAQPIYEREIHDHQTSDCIGIIKPYAGKIHYHVNYDDGEESIEECKNKALKQGLSFVFITPHAQSVDHEIKEVNLSTRKGKIGYQSFINECHYYSDDKIKIIPGAEFGERSHYLALGIYDASIFYRALDLQTNQGQREAIAYLRQNNIVVIAAHPDMVRKHPDRHNIFQRSETWYKFDFTSVNSSPANGLNGFELLNNGTVDTLNDNLRHVINYSLVGLPVVIGGCDFHTKLAEQAAKISKSQFPEADKRLTIIWAPRFTTDALLNGLRYSHTAACYAHDGRFDTKKLPLAFLPGTTIFFERGSRPFWTFSLDGYRNAVGEYMWIRIYEPKGGPQLLTKRWKLKLEDDFCIWLNDEWPNDTHVHPVQKYILVLKTRHYYLVSSFITRAYETQF